LSPGDKFQEWIVIEKDSVKHSRNRQFYLCRCSCGIIRSVSMADLLQGSSCNCGHSRYTLSKGACAIKDFLVSHNYDFYQEYMFKNFPRRYYDFALYNKNNPDQIIRLIEFDGEQHSLTSKSNWHNETLVKRDQEKNQYALTNKIPLVRIPYYKILISEDDLFTDKYEVKE
jgi:hypothetical protein